MTTGGCKGVKLRVISGKNAKLLALLGCSIAHIERSHLTSWLFNGLQVCKTLAFSKDLTAHQAAVMWEGSCYNLVRPHKSLRVLWVAVGPQKWQRRTPAMAARLTDHIWTVKELLTTLPLPRAINT